MRLTTALIVLLLPTCALADTKATFTLPSGVTVEITEAPFNKARFKVRGCTEGGTHCLINGHAPFGSADDLPKTYVKRIMVSYHGRTYALDARDMFDAWGDRPLQYEQFGVRYFGGKCFDDRDCQFRGVFSDAAGSFVAEWAVIDGRSTRIVISGDSDIVTLFLQNIDPPEYD